jgi:hypothetical protein
LSTETLFLDGYQMAEEVPGMLWLEHGAGIAE